MALTKIGKEGITGISNSANANAITIDSGENVTLSGTLATTVISIADGSSTQNRLTIGTNDDFFIYHDNQTVIANKNSSGPIKIQAKFGEQSIVANQDAGVELYYNHEKVFETASTGVTIEDPSTTSASKSLRIIGKRNDANDSFAFSGKLMLATNRTDQLVDTGKAIGIIGFGGNHTDGTVGNILYSSAIVGRSEGDFNSATDMPTGLAFHTSSTGRDPDTPNVTMGTERMRITSAGKVGIGTTSPSAGLHLEGTANNLASQLKITATGVVSQYIGGSSSEGLSIGHDHGSLPIVFKTGVNSGTGVTGSGTERMRIDANGHVGIGNTASGFNSQAQNLVVGTGSGDAGITIYSGSGSGDSGNIFFADGTSGSDPVRGGVTYNHETNAMNFRVNDAPRIYILSDGKVGIGDDSPQQPLHVKNSTFAYIRAETSASTKTGIDFGQHQDGTGHINMRDAHHIKISTADTERMRIKDDGNVFIGTTSGSNKLEVDGGSSQVRLRVSTTGTDAKEAGIILANSSKSAYNDGIEIAHGAGYTSFSGLGGAELLRLHASGNLSIQNTDNVAGIKIFKHLQQYNGISIQNGTNNDGQIFQSFLRSDGSVVGSISQSGGGSNVSFNTSSDYRLKENVTYNFDATTRLKQLKPARFNWISDNTNTLEDGFIAHEVSDIVPEAIVGEKDGVQNLGTVKDKDGNIVEKNVSEILFTERKKETLDNEGNTINATYSSDNTWTKTSTENVYQTIDHSKLVPLLVKTIQELEARITALEKA